MHVTAISAFTPTRDPHVGDSSSVIASTSTLSGVGYYTTMAAGSMIATGDVLALFATGATVPPLHGYVAMPPPPPSSWTTPLASVSRSADFVFTWSTVAADEVWIGIRNPGWPMPPTFVQCSAPSSARAITIPRRITARFPVGDAHVFLATVNVQVVAAGDYRVQFTASQTVQAIDNVSP